jgi:hypothetical protein
LLVNCTLDNNNRAFGQPSDPLTPTEAVMTAIDRKNEIVDVNSTMVRCNVLSSSVNSNNSNPALVMQFPEHLVAAAVPQVEREKWNQISNNLWDMLTTLDFDFVDNTTGMIVPATFPGAVVKAPVMCGRVARTWVSCKWIGTRHVNE